MASFAAAEARRLIFEGNAPDGVRVTWFVPARAGTRRRALASDGVHTLIESDAGQILAGCRGPWSRAEALAHWGNPARKGERAKLFAAALRAPPAADEPLDAGEQA